MYYIGNGLCVGRRPRPTAPDCVVHLGQFVGYSVCDEGTCCGAGVGAEDDALGERYGHADDRGLGVVDTFWERRGAYIEVPRLRRVNVSHWREKALGRLFT